MKKQTHPAVIVAGAIAVALMLAVPDAGLAQNLGSSSQRGVITTAYDLTGVVQSTNRRLNYVTVRTDRGQSVKIDVRRLNTRQSINVWNLRPGDRIAVNGGWENRNTFRASVVSGYGYGTMASTYGNPNQMMGTVENVNRRLNYVSVRNLATGQVVKVDVRSMDTRHSINVWNLRAGDRVVVDGGWENGNTFRANRVNF